MPHQRGFTIVELMIALAIVGVLSAFAVSAYQNYIARAQVSDAFVMSSNVRTRIAEYGYFNGAFPDLASQPSSASFANESPASIMSVEPGTGIVTVTMKAAGQVNGSIAGCAIHFTPAPLDQDVNQLTFTCVSDCPAKFLPQHCR